MHSFSIPADLTERVIKRAGRAHPFDTLDAAKTAFVVVDMQNYFVHPDYQGAVPMAQSVASGEVKATTYSLPAVVNPLIEQGAPIVFVEVLNTQAPAQIHNAAASKAAQVPAMKNLVVITSPKCRSLIWAMVTVRMAQAKRRVGRERGRLPR